MRITAVDKPRQKHARSQHQTDAGGLALSCETRHEPPIAATGLGRREGPSPDTTFHRLGGESAFSYPALRSASKGGNVRRTERAAAIQNLPAFWANAA
jgi:hypothetical protein